MVFDRVILEVCETSKVDFEEGGVDQQTLEDMKMVSVFSVLVPFFRNCCSSKTIHFRAVRLVPPDVLVVVWRIFAVALGIFIFTWFHYLCCVVARAGLGDPLLKGRFGVPMSHFIATPITSALAALRAWETFDD